MSKRRERTTSAISAGRKKRQKVARYSERDQGPLQDFSEDESNSESQENVTSGRVSSHVFPRSHSDAGSQEAGGNESSEPSELEYEGEDDTTGAGGDDDHERTSVTSGDGDGEFSASGETESESDDNTDSVSSYHLSGSDDDGSSIRTVRPRTRNQPIRPPDSELEASSLNGHEDEDSSELLSLDSEDIPSDTVSSVRQGRPLVILNTSFTEIQSKQRTRLTQSSEEPDGLTSPSSSDEESGDDYAPKSKAAKKKINRKAARDEALASSRDTLYINDPDFQETFTNLRFPYFPERLEIGAPIPNDPAGTEQENERRRKKSTTRGGKSVEGRSFQDKKYYDASSITQEQLVKRELWKFASHRPWDKSEPPEKPPNFYESLGLTKRTKDQADNTKARLFAPPIDFRNSIKIELSEKPHINILRHVNVLRYEFEHEEHALELPNDWERSERLGGRPEMPEIYAQILNMARVVDTGTRESTPFSDYLSGGGPSAQPTPLKSTRIEEADSSINNGQPLHSPDAEQLSIPHMKAPQGNSSAHSTDEPSGSERNTTDAQKFIDQNNLEANLSAARMLAAYLEPLQLEYDIESLKLQISDLMRSRNLKGIKYLPRDYIISQNKTQCTGKAILSGDNDRKMEKMSLEWLLKWLQYTGEALANIPNPTEAQVEHHVGSLLEGCFASAKLHETANASLKYERHLRLFDTSPRPDLAAVAYGKQWDHWGDQLLLCVCCGDCKVWGQRVKPDPQWAAQLAMSVGATLNVLTLIHLDTRKNALNHMPHWMWVPGIIYTEKGYTIYVHHPGVFIGQDKTWKWNHVSMKLTETFSKIYPVEKFDAKHASASQALSKLREHSEFVLDQILAWARTRGQFGEGVMDQFIARSRYDAGELNWVLDAAKNYVSPLA